LKFKGPLLIVCNMWKVFTRPTCASDFFFQKSCQFFSFFMFKTHICTKNSKVVESSRCLLKIWLKLAVSVLCGPGEKRVYIRNFAWTCLARFRLKLRSQIWNFLEFAKEFSWKTPKMLLSPSGYKLESWNFAWTCFVSFNMKLYTQI
jgi:hypothetical protein